MNKKKSVKIKVPESLKNPIDSIADEFVGIIENTINKNPEEPKKKFRDNASKLQLEHIEKSRFTIVIPSYLHTRIKKYCVTNSVSIKETMTEILLKEFPEI